MSSYEHYLKLPEAYEGKVEEILVEFTVTSWGAPESGPTYSSGGEPAEPPEIEIDKIYVDGNLVPYPGEEWDKLAALANDQIFEDFDFEAASEPDYDDYWD